MTSMTAAGFTEQYDRLVAALGEDPLRPGAPLQLVEDPAVAVAVVARPAERARLLESLAGQSLRCAELIAQTLAASGSLSRLQKRLADAADKAGGDDESMDEEDSEEEEVEEDEQRSALLLQDLVAAGAQLEEAAKHHAQLGVADKALRSSRALLAGAERELTATATASGGSLGDGALQSEFRDLYMEEFTSAFGDSLDQFRQEEQFESKDVAYLISCIHAGGDVFSPLQKKLFVESVKASGEQ